EFRRPVSRRIGLRRIGLVRQLWMVDADTRAGIVFLDPNSLYGEPSCVRFVFFSSWWPAPRNTDRRQQSNTSISGNSQAKGRVSLRGVQVRRRSIVQGFGQSKVEHFDLAFRGDLDVRGLQITANDALVMRRLERLADIRAARGASA